MVNLAIKEDQLRHGAMVPSTLVLFPFSHSAFFSPYLSYLLSSGHTHTFFLFLPFSLSLSFLLSLSPTLPPSVHLSIIRSFTHSLPSQRHTHTYTYPAHTAVMHDSDDDQASMRNATPSNRVRRSHQRSPGRKWRNSGDDTDSEPNDGYGEFASDAEHSAYFPSRSSRRNNNSPGRGGELEEDDELHEKPMTPVSFFFLLLIFIEAVIMIY